MKVEIKVIKAFSSEDFEDRLSKAVSEGWHIIDGQQMVVTYLGQKIDSNKPTHCNIYDLIQYSILLEKINETSN